MTRGPLRTLLTLALLVSLPLASAVHVAHAESAERPGVSANGHGPWSHCPPANETPCLACASATLFAPPPAAPAALPGPLAAERLRDEVSERASSGPRTASVGRSPPAS